MKVFGVVGWSGSGKTSLIVRLLPELRRRGLAVSTMKHTHHRFDLDRPGKDSFQHREAGAQEVMVVSSQRWALMHELRDGPEPTVQSLIDRLAPVDVLLIEGFKHHPHPKIEVHRPELGKPILAAEDPGIVAVASTAPLPGLDRPRLDLDDTAAVAAFIVAYAPPAARAAP